MYHLMKDHHVSVTEGAGDVSKAVTYIRFPIYFRFAATGWLQILRRAKVEGSLVNAGIMEGGQPDKRVIANQSCKGWQITVGGV